MWQFIGVSAFLTALAGLQLLWPSPLPGLNSAPALLLLAAACVLSVLPLRRLFFWVLLLAFGFDLLLNEMPYCLIGYALTLALPMSRDSSEDEGGASWAASLGWMLVSVLIFDLLMALLGSFYGSGAWRLFLGHLPATLGYNLLAALLLLPLTRGLISLLHYQRFEYDRDVRSGRLG